jgi:hypothetical protein
MADQFSQNTQFLADYAMKNIHCQLFGVKYQHGKYKSNLNR